MAFPWFCYWVLRELSNLWLLTVLVYQIWSQLTTDWIPVLEFKRSSGWSMFKRLIEIQLTAIMSSDLIWVGVVLPRPSPNIAASFQWIYILDIFLQVCRLPRKLRGDGLCSIDCFTCVARNLTDNTDMVVNGKSSHIVVIMDIMTRFHRLNWMSKFKCFPSKLLL